MAKETVPGVSESHGPVAKSDGDTRYWLTRVELVDLLDVTVSQLIRLEEKGVLHPKKSPSKATTGPREIIVYDPKELAANAGVLRKRVTASPGEQSARAFEAFDRGLSVREVVVDLRVTGQRAQKLHEEWKDAGGSELVITETAKADLVRLVGPFGGVADLVEIVTARLAVEEIMAAVPFDASDARVEGAIVAALDQAEAGR